ncbi:MAG: L-2-hydroxyglutarate oxidase [Gemmatimonadetes bacterium]|nr:L-2-hydroxyglutarate oxidase [Gemmatimonadota bacterium]MDA1103398.1 L-2-hydroxyglutarate oxidase [Gemmatimonadota bacterium]
MSNRPRADVTIIGGGIVGLATAHALLERGVEAVRVLEKESAVAQHQSTHNSGVLHAGLQYAPGSEKARLARVGIRRMTEFCRHHGIAHDICGKLVVATDTSELPRLTSMLERGGENGLEGLKLLAPEEAGEIEPHVRCVGAILVPEEGIADYAEVCRVLRREVESKGGEVICGAEVHRLVREDIGWRIVVSNGEVTTRVLVNCGGLYSDRIAAMAGSAPTSRILPFRGEYLRLRPEREHLVRHLIYPLPEPGFPFLGVHFTRRITGGIDAGPNAVLAFSREGYDRTTLHLRDLFEALTFPGLWRFTYRHRRMVVRELAQSFNSARFVAALQRLVPEVQADDLIAGGSGVRAQAVAPSGDFVHDFLWMESPGAVHAINAPSPAATASLAIGEEIALRAMRHLS